MRRSIAKRLTVHPPAPTPRVRLGILDVACPMAYTPETEVFREQISGAVETAGAARTSVDDRDTSYLQRVGERAFPNR